MYVALAAIALWGAFCVILVWRRVAQTRFASEEEQTEFVNELSQSLETGDDQAAIDLCEGDRRALPQLALLALHHREDSPTKMRQIVSDRFQRDVLADLDDRLSWVSTVIKSAPMVGLLGTVVGMMGAFAELSGDKVNPAKMAENIMLALITTACGLSIAIPLILCVNSISVRMRKMEELVASGLTQLLEVLKGSAGRPAAKPRTKSRAASGDHEPPALDQALPAEAGREK